MNYGSAINDKVTPGELFFGGQNIFGFAKNNAIEYFDPDGRILPVLAVAIAWASWQVVCGVISANEAADFAAETGAGDSAQHCFASCYHNRCTGLFQPAFTLIGGALWELRPGGTADFDDVVADAYGVIVAYQVWDSCDTLCRPEDPPCGTPGRW